MSSLIATITHRRNDVSFGVVAGAAAPAAILLCLLLLLQTISPDAVGVTATKTFLDEAFPTPHTYRAFGAQCATLAFLIDVFADAAAEIRKQRNYAVKQYVRFHELLHTHYPNYESRISTTNLDKKNQVASKNALIDLIKKFLGMADADKIFTESISNAPRLDEIDSVTWETNAATRVSDLTPVRHALETLATKLSAQNLLATLKREEAGGHDARFNDREYATNALAYLNGKSGKLARLDKD